MNLSVLLRLKSDLAGLHIKLGLRKLELAIKFDQNQPRIPTGQPGGGRWIGDRNENIPINADKINSIENIKPLRSSFRTEEYCDEQYKRDVFQCKMVGLRSCYAQAMVRLVACERGHSIPPLNY